MFADQFYMHRVLMKRKDYIIEATGAFLFPEIGTFNETVKSYLPAYSCLQHTLAPICIAHKVNI